MRLAVLAILICLGLSPPTFAISIDKNLWPVLVEGSFKNSQDAMRALVLVLHFGDNHALRTRAVANILQYVPRREVDTPLFRQTFGRLYRSTADPAAKTELKASLDKLDLWQPTKTFWERCADPLRNFILPAMTSRK